VNVDDHQIALYVYGAIIGLIVIGVPCVLMGMLLYHGLRQDLQDLKLLRRKRVQRGFDVIKNAGQSPDPPRSEHENPRVPGPPDSQ